ncbi:MAG: DUF4325 domain-containing protein [Ruminococcaceae bacterium]|nr:DUF4325 domain-containing protein [Oscillospiraceae bacterium]
MKFDAEKKNAIIQYIIEKIAEKSDRLVSSVQETFGINESTVHSYIKKLLQGEVIRKIKRGEYELISQETTFVLDRNNGDLDDDSHAYSGYLKTLIADLGENVKGIWEYTFSEMINNVIDHSQAERAVVIVSRNHFETVVTIADDGIGIFEKIKNHFNLDSYDDAVCELFKGKLTTDETRHSGEGIFFSSKIMDGFLIASSGKLFTVNKYDDSRTLDLPEFSNEKGTVVIMALSNHSKKQAKEIFDEYSDEDSRFVKTKLPLKNIFETSPVSRSQARRICNQLSKFEEVILDFDKVEWMGQGFAHQIFVVFQNEYPGIKLSPVNMNESIKKMYNHVTKS